MEVTEAKYIKSSISENNVNVQATIDGTVLFTSLDPANRHYAAILEWVDAGNTIAAAD